MKKFITVLVVILLPVCLSASAAMAKQQLKTPPKPSLTVPVKPVKPEVDIKKIPKLVLPDLVIDNFTIENEGMTEHENQMHFPISARVRNVGNGKVDKPFYVVFEYYKDNLGRWEPDRTSSHAIKVNTAISPAQSINITGYLKIGKVMASDRNFRVRTVVDSLEFEEFPSEGGKISESNENNNVSNEITLSTPYVAELTGIDKEAAIRGVDTVFIQGIGLGEQSEVRILVIESKGEKIQAEVTRWTPGGINFKVPANTPTGESLVYIADSGTLNQLTHSLPVIVAERKSLKWNKFMDAFNLFGGAFSIRLHTWSGGSNYQNVSQMTTLDSSNPVLLNVPKIQFKTDLGYYRFLINDFKTLDINHSENAFSVDKQNCASNQMRLLIRFESEKKELIGYYKVLGPAGSWRREGAPDINVNNGVVTILFQFNDPGIGALDYKAAANFTGDISASGSVWNTILDLFMSDWDRKVRKEVNAGIRNAINSQQVKQSITTSFMDFIRFQLSIRSHHKIRNFDFTNDAIVVIYY